MSNRELKSEREAFVKRFYELGREYKAANPDGAPSFGIWLIRLAVTRLKEAIEDARITETTWDQASNMMGWLVTLTGDFRPRYINVTPKDLQDRKAIGEALLGHFLNGMVVDLLRMWTKDVGIHVDGDRQWFTCPPKLANELNRLSGAEFSRRKQEVLEPSPVVMPFAFPSDWRYWDSAKIRGALEIEFLPLFVVHPRNRGFYPIFTSLSFSNCHPKILPDDWKRQFWMHLFKAIDAEMMKADVGCLSGLVRDMNLVEVRFRKLVPPEHVKPYRAMIESFADWQAQHLEKTGAFLPVEGPLRLIPPRTALTERQERGCQKHEYRRHETIHILGAVPLRRSNLVVVGETEIRIGDSDLLLLLGLAKELKKGKGGWVHINDLISAGVISRHGRYQALGRLRKALQSALPAAATLELIQGDDSGRFRLSVHPDFVTYEKSKLLKHPDGRIREVAKQLPRQRSADARPRSQ